MNAAHYLVSEAPSQLFYIPNFISEEEEKLIIDKVYSAPKPKWVQLRNRRLQNWGGNPSKNGMIIETIPLWLQMFMKRVDELNSFDEGCKKTNHVLINEYLPGQGIMPHEDGPLFYPTIATISCGSGTVLKFEKKKAEVIDNDDDTDLPQKLEVFLERRSLVIVKGNLYHDYLHSIDEQMADVIKSDLRNITVLSQPTDEIVNRDTRISLTIRHALKVSRLQLLLGK